MLSFSFKTLDELKDALDWETELLDNLKNIYSQMYRENDKRYETIRQVLEIFDEIKGD